MSVREAVGTGTVHRWRWVALAALLTAEAMNLLDATVVAVAAPVVHADLGGAVSDVQWFGAAYTLPFAVLLLVGGRLGDLAGRRRMFVVGTGAFALASTACALAAGPGALIAARAVQGAAAALAIPQTIGLIRVMFDGRELARAMGAIGPVMGLTAVCGPVLGAVITHADLFGSSWRAAFLLNVPPAVAVLALAPLLREDRAPRTPRLDLPGAALAASGTGLVVYPLIQEGAGLWPLPLGAGALAAFAFHQRARARRGLGSLVEPSLFRDRGFPAALATSTLFFALTTGLTLVVALHVQLGHGGGVLTAGLTLLPWSCGLAVASWFAGARLVPRHGSRVMFAGLAVLLLGLLVAVAAYDTSREWRLAALALCGVGNGLFAPAFFTTALSRVRPHETGSAAGLLNAVQQFGGTLGTALLGRVFLHALAAHSAAHAIRLTFWCAAGVVAATAAAGAFMTAREPR
ncbi:MFS transporter [Actinomadura kijaniata]|uniref:MFS transporter n=1 Tax=Actinomadura kijaniata TaxID=46161 RepID=UPI003F1DE1E8